MQKCIFLLPPVALPPCRDVQKVLSKGDAYFLRKLLTGDVEAPKPDSLPPSFINSLIDSFIH